MVPSCMVFLNPSNSNWLPKLPSLEDRERLRAIVNCPSRGRISDTANVTKGRPGQSKNWSGVTGFDTSCGSNRCYPVPPYYDVRLAKESRNHHEIDIPHPVRKGRPRCLEFPRMVPTWKGRNQLPSLCTGTSARCHGGPPGRPHSRRRTRFTDT
jgi:hypothetical protein